MMPGEQLPRYTVPRASAVINRRPDTCDLSYLDRRQNASFSRVYKIKTFRVFMSTIIFPYEKKKKIALKTLYGVKCLGTTNSGGGSLRHNL